MIVSIKSNKLLQNADSVSVMCCAVYDSNIMISSQDIGIFSCPRLQPDTSPSFCKRMLLTTSF